MSTNYLVYGIYDIQDPERIRYVGMTTGDLKTRLRNHWAYSDPKYRRSRIQCWMYSRRNRRGDVRMVVLDSVKDFEELKRAEMEQIKKFREKGMADLNLTDGGEGMLGYRRSEESKRQISEKYRKTGGPYAKLTWEDVRRIRKDRMERYEPAEEVAKRYGVQRTAIDRILRNELWIDETFNPDDVKPRPGGMHVGAKIPMEKVREIREHRTREWRSAKSIAEENGVTEPVIQNILRNKSYHDPEFDPSKVIPRPRRGNKK